MLGRFGTCSALAFGLISANRIGELQERLSVSDGIDAGLTDGEWTEDASSDKGDIAEDLKKLITDVQEAVEDAGSDGEEDAEAEAVDDQQAFFPMEVVLGDNAEGVVDGPVKEFYTAARADPEFLADKEANDHADPVLADNSMAPSTSTRTLPTSCTQAKLVFTTDMYGFENSWNLTKLSSNGNGWTLVQAGPPANTKYYGNRTYYGSFCLPPGRYKFTVNDLFKDGMCCKNGQGGYKILVDNKVVVTSPTDGSAWSKKTHGFWIQVPSSNNNNNANNVPTRVPTTAPTTAPNQNNNGNIIDKTQTDRDREWLEAHNTRRKKWHLANDKTYVPLKWSPALAQESTEFAQLLVKDCGALWHDPRNPHGENLAANYGSGSFAALKTPDSVVNRWVEGEENKPWPGNGHLTQVLWRASQYVGCGEDVLQCKGQTARVQVCRYARPGNCNMGAYKDNTKTWWKKPMLDDYSGCGSRCPPDGCF